MEFNGGLRSQEVRFMSSIFFLAHHGRLYHYCGKGGYKTLAAAYIGKSYTTVGSIEKKAHQIEAIFFKVTFFSKVKI